MNTHFEFINFEPRENIQSLTDHLMSELNKKLPHRASGRGVIKFNGNGFHFSVMVNSEQGVLSADAYISSAEAKTRKRHWQIPVLNRLVYDVINQMTTWKFADRKVDFD